MSQKAHFARTGTRTPLLSEYYGKLRGLSFAPGVGASGGLKDENARVGPPFTMWVVHVGRSFSACRRNAGRSLTSPIPANGNQRKVRIISPSDPRNSTLRVGPRNSSCLEIQPDLVLRPAAVAIRIEVLGHPQETTYGNMATNFLLHLALEGDAGLLA